MELLTLVGTLSGAALGVVSTLAAETLRARRDRRSRLDSVRRETYARYLQALTRTDAALQALAKRSAGPVVEDEALGAFRSEGLLASRYEVGLIASSEVADAAEDAYRRLRDIREAMIASHLVVNTVNARDNAQTSTWRAVHLPYVASLSTLRETMRQDVQAR